MGPLSRYLGQPLSPVTTRKLLHDTGLTIEDVVSRSRAGDRKARSALQETAKYLGLGIAGIINAINPARVYVGGEITAVWDELLPHIRKGVKSRALTKATAATPIIPESASEHPRLRGATTLVAAPQFAAHRVG
jgi:predicted NBD/HSP70 family sugar kinase